jgi:chromosome segregation ATPase
MQRKVHLPILIIVAASLCLSKPTPAGAQAGVVPAAPQTKFDALEAAIVRAVELSQHAAALGGEAAKQRAELEALRSSLAVENQKQAAALAARGKELDDARGQLASLQKQVGELRAAVAERQSASDRQANVEQQLAAKDAEILAARAEVQKLQGAIAREHEEREKARAATQHLAEEKQALEAELKRVTSAKASTSGASVSSAPQPQTDEGVAAAADGTGIKKWQKPDGSLFFGERPPPESKFLGYTTGGGL